MRIRTINLFLSCLIIFTSLSNAQTNARMLQYPDVSSTQITFAYAGDIWIVPKEGGTATKLSSPQGSEILPKFSPDGKFIAFSGNYAGNADIYVLSVSGGSAQRITSHVNTDRMLDWTPDGEKILFASSMSSGRQRFSQLYSSSKTGGLPEKLPVPYGEFASFSPDGQNIAYTPRTRSFRTWKRYKGGMSADIWIFNLKTYESENITNNPSNDEFPMWINDRVYFLSDRGEENRFNLWVYELGTKLTRQITDFTEFDIHFPSIGPEEIVFEAGGRLYLLDINTEKYKEVLVNVVTDGITLMPRSENVKKLISNAGISPNGKRIVFEARGDLFSVPAEHGFIKNLTSTSGAAERFPSWSPDGKYIAFWSDKTGEYELTLYNTESEIEEKTLTSSGKKFKYKLYWSPDSKKIAYVNNAMEIKIFDLNSNSDINVDKGLSMFEGTLDAFKVGWSSDSRFMTYSRGTENNNGAIFIYDTKEEVRHQMTSGYYNDNQPVFDPEGKYLYFLTNRTFSPKYSDVDNSFIYPNSTNIAAVALRNDVPSPLAPRNDSIEIKAETEKKPDEKKEEEVKPEKVVEEVVIDFTDFERRMVILPPKSGNLNNIQAVEGKIIYHRLPNTGSEKDQKPLVYYDLKEREEKTIIDNVDSYMLTADNKKILVSKDQDFALIEVKEGQKMDKKINTNDLELTVTPREEWKQIFNDVWRFERDYFYDENMHGVDWEELREKYGRLVDETVTRDDLNYILGELIGELNASHTYRGGGDTETELSKSVGFLGIDWKISNDFYQIDKIIKGAPWDNEVRSSLDQPGINVKEGDYILAVNGIPIDITKDPWFSFQGLADKTIELTVNSLPSMKGSKKIIVETLSSESRLRHLQWIENNRKRVDEATGGQIGYIYVRSTGIDGQNELVRQFAAQFNKKGLIIDERFNSGGQIPDRFIELLDRKPLAFWAVRDGKTWQWPPSANFGPKVMLINGWSGSGGDAFPDFFRKAGLGPLIGSRTWGGLIGISGVPGLIDGGFVTVPTFRMFDPDGKWFLEGHGVDPDIEVIEDPTLLAKGIDNQLEKAIEEINRLLDSKPDPIPKIPSREKR